MSLFDGLGWSASQRAWRNELYNELSKHQRGMASDAGAELQRDDWDAKEELASGHQLVDQFLKLTGVDAQSDPYYSFKMISGDNFGKSLLADRGELSIDPAFKQEFKAWAYQFDNQVVQPYIDRVVGSDGFLTQLGVYRDNRSLKEIQSVSGRVGLSFDRHADRMLAIIHGATTSLEVGMFTFEHATMVEAVARRANEGLATRMRLNSPISTLGRVSQTLFSKLLGSEFSVSKPFETDHFKFMAANLGGALQDRMFLLGSINATQAALGMVTTRTGVRGNESGTNLESSFMLTYDAVREGLMSEAVFHRLTTQANAAAHWIHGGDPDRGTQFDKSGEVRSQILTGQGLAEQHVNMMQRLTEKGGTATLVTYNIGSDFLGHVKKAITQNSSAKVKILLGSRYTGFDQFGMPSMTNETPGLGSINSFIDEIRKQYGAGADEILSRLEVVVDHQQLIHAKISTFELGDGMNIALYGSMNLDNEQFRGEYYEERSMDYWGQIRNLGVMLTSEEYKLLNSGVSGSETDLLRRMMRTSSLFVPMAPGWNPLIDGAMDAQAIKKIQGHYNALSAQYGLADNTFTVKNVLNNLGVSSGSYARARIGGVYHVRNATINRKVRYDLGSLMDLTMVRPDGRFGFDSQVFIPELSKFIGQVAGVGSYTAEDEKSAMPVGPVLFQADTIVASGIRSVNEAITRRLESLTLLYGQDRVRAMLQNPYERGRLRQAVKMMVRDSFKNFAGYEPGTAAYDAKRHAALMYARREDGTLDLGRLSFEPGERSERLMIDARAINDVLTQRDQPGRRGTMKGRRLQLKGSFEFVFSSGQLSRFGSSGASVPRVYSTEMFRTLPMAAKFERRDANGDPSGLQEYFFLLPASKISQLPQRLQNIMSARNLSTLEDYGIGNNLADESRFIGEDDRAMKGIRLRGLMLPGLAGDNMYTIGEQFEGQLFGDEAFRQDANIKSSSVIRDTMGTVLDEALDHLINAGLAERRGDHIIISSAGLEAINYELPVAEHYLGGGEKALQTIALKASKMPGSSLILDMKAGRGTGLRRAPGKFIRSITGVWAREAFSGDRIVLNAKAPTAMLQEKSPFVQSIVHAVDQSDTAGILNAMGFFETDASGNRVSRVSAIFGSGVIKAGGAFIETGLEAIETGAFEQQLHVLESRGISIQDILKGTNSKYLDLNFGALFEKLKPMMSSSEQIHVQSLLDSNSPTEILKLIQETQGFLVGGGKVSLTKTPRYAAAALAAFGVHALYFLTAQEGQLDAMNRVVGRTHAGGRLANVNLDDMSATQVLGIVPLSLVTAISASATGMSSRDRVNFLNYHSGGYTDAFMDLMAMSSKVRDRATAYRELTVGGLLGVGGMDEVFLPQREFNPMTYFQSGYEDEFTKILRITRELQGHGGGPLNIGRVKELEAEFNLAMTSLSNKKAEFVGQSGYAFKSWGEMTSAQIQSFLSVQERAGVGSRTIVVPEVGFTDANGIFHFDILKPEVVRMRQVKFLSARSLKALGSFEDYSHEIQRLQVEVERKMYLLRGMYDSKFGIKTKFTMQEKEAYTELMELIGALETAQRGAAATDLQKQLGGQLALTGRNMIAGVLPEIENGFMVLGEEPWQLMKEGLKKEILRGAQRSNLAGLSLTDKVSRLIDGLEGASDVKAKALSALAGSDDNLDYLKKKVELGVAQAKSSQVSFMSNALEDGYELDALKSQKQMYRRLAKMAKESGNVDELKALREQLRGINKQIDEFHKGRSLQSMQIDAQAYAFNQEVLRLEADIEEMLALDAIDVILSDQRTRAGFTRGVFQRAGAPMGPMAMVLSKILTVAEFNELGPAMRIHEYMSRRSMFIFAGAMAFNLGDFDGDTASVAYLAKLAELNTMQRLGGKLNAVEQTRLNEANRQLGLSTEEAGIRFARYYTGWNEMFSDKNLYIGKDAVLAKKGVNEARNLLHTLEAKAERILRAHGIKDSEFSQYNGSQLEALASQKGIAFSSLQARILDDFRTRKKNLYDLSIASSEYASGIYGLATDIAEKVQMISMSQGVDTQTAFTRFWSSKEAHALGVEKFKKSLESVLKSTGGGDSSLSWRELVTFFTMTTFSSTVMIGKLFEVSYTAQIVADADRSRYAVESSALIMNSVRGTDAEGLFRTGARSLDRGSARDVINRARDLLREKGAPLTRQQRGTMRSAIERYDLMLERHADLGGIILVAQQMAREAIKPKGGKDMLTYVREKLALLGGSDAVADAVDIAMESPRAQAMNMLYQIIEGKSLGGGAVDTRAWGFKALPRDDKGNVVLMPGVADYGWSMAEHTIKEGLIDYYKGQVGAVFAAGATRSEIYSALTGVDESNGNALFGSSEGVAEAQSSALREVFKAYEEGKIAPSELELQQHRALVQGYLEQTAAARAMTAVQMAQRTSGTRDARNRFMRAVDSGNRTYYNAVSGTLSRAERVQMLGASSARGKFQTEEGLSMVLEDVFNSYDSVEDLLKDAQRVNDSSTFADQLAKMYAEYHSSGSMKRAFMRAARHANQKVEEQKARLDADIAAVHEKSMGSKKKNKEIEKLKEAYKAEQDRQKLVSRMEASLAETMSFKQAMLQERPGAITSVEYAGILGEHALEAINRGSAPAHAAGGVLSNVIIPALVYQAAGGTMAATGHLIGADTTGEMASTVGEFSAAAIGMYNPIAMMKNAVHHNDAEARVRTGMLMATFGTGMIAGHMAGEATGRMLANANLPKMAGLGGLVGAGLAGALVGSVMGVGLEAIGLKMGWLSNTGHKSVGEINLSDAMSEFMTASTAAAEEAVEMLEDGEGGGVTEFVQMVDASGEVIADAEFYIESAATRDADDAQHADIQLTDPDTYVASHSVDNQSNSGDAGLYGADYRGAAQVDS